MAGRHYRDGYRHGVSIASLLLDDDNALEAWGAEQCTTLVQVAERAGSWGLDDFRVNAERRRGFVDGFVHATRTTGLQLRIGA